MKHSTGWMVGALLAVAAQSSLVYAVERSDPRLVAHEQAVQAYAQAHGLAVPQVRDYQYGMNLDVQKVILQTSSTRSCTAEPMLMTYTDSSGQLVTLRYSEEGSCPKAQG